MQWNHPTHYNIPHRGAVCIHVAQLRDGVLGVDRDDDLCPRLVPVKPTRNHFLTLRGYFRQTFWSSVRLFDTRIQNSAVWSLPQSISCASVYQTLVDGVELRLSHAEVITCCEVGTPTSSFFLHRCVPLVQPSWERKVLKSEVFLLQQLQYFILETQERHTPAGFLAVS